MARANSGSSELALTPGVNRAHRTRMLTNSSMSPKATRVGTSSPSGFTKKVTAIKTKTMGRT